jgi:hypothetical protein
MLGLLRIALVAVMPLAFGLWVKHLGYGNGWAFFFGFIVFIIAAALTNDGPCRL